MSLVTLCAERTESVGKKVRSKGCDGTVITVTLIAHTVGHVYPQERPESGSEQVPDFGSRDQEDGLSVGTLVLNK